MTSGRRRLAGGLCMLVLGSLPTAGASPRQPEPAATPRLIVVVMVDQLRADYLRRYGDSFTGGLGRLYREGAVYLNGLQDHAITQTAPGHATTLSGRSPAATGIVSNDLGVPDPASPVLAAPGTTGASPHRFTGTALYDWLVARDSASLVLSVARKDRSAILSVGRARGQVYWYVPAAGGFTTSRWYADALPTWVRAWNARDGAARLAGGWWLLLRPDSAYQSADRFRYENRGTDLVFPHRIPGGDSIATEIIRFPWMDSLTLDVALEGVVRIGVGRRGRGTDLLIVGLSALDDIGHDYGPDSRETEDHLLRVDRWFGRFLDSLGSLVPAGRTIIALSADHGVSSVPEMTTVARRPSGRIWLTPAAELRRRYEERYSTAFGFQFTYGLMMADVARLAARGVDVRRLSDSLAREMRRVPGVTAVYTPGSIAAAPASDSAAERWRRQIPPGLGWLYAVVASDTLIWAPPGGFNHGGSRFDERSVPIIVAGSGIRPGRYERPVRVQHLAATLAALAGVTPTERIEGRPLPEVMRR